MRRLMIGFVAIAALATAGTAQPARRSVQRAEPGPKPGLVRVRLITSEGPILLALDARHAPKTTANFLAYVDDGRFDGTDFYRADARLNETELRRGFLAAGAVEIGAVEPAVIDIGQEIRGRLRRMAGVEGQQDGALGRDDADAD
ncbi:MAG: hypothetical protein EOP67_18430 [Sphingomonas sp.]|nr:MAG: hypothetical protein EOP67_18430 [Sphingomonas sp.]